MKRGVFSSSYDRHGNQEMVFLWFPWQLLLKEKIPLLVLES